MGRQVKILFLVLFFVLLVIDFGNDGALGNFKICSPSSLVKVTSLASDLDDSGKFAFLSEVAATHLLEPSCPPKLLLRNAKIQPPLKEFFPLQQQAVPAARPCNPETVSYQCIPSHSFPFNV